MNSKLLPTLAAVSLLAAALPNARAAQPMARDSNVPTGTVTFAVTPNAARWQAKTKAQVVGFRLGHDNVFDGVVVFNGSNSTLTSVRIGCIVEAPNAQTGDGLILGNVLLGVWDDTDIVHVVDIAPGEIGVVRTPQIPFDSIAGILIALLLPAHTEVTATLGITHAAWENGRTYRRDARRGFPEKPNRYRESDFALVDTSEIVVAIESIEPPVIDPVPGAAQREVTHSCVEAPKWMCVVSAVTGQCIGSAMSNSGLASSGKCKASVVVSPSAP